MARGVGEEGVHPQLGDQDIRVKGFQERRHHLVKGLQIDLVVGLVLEGDVDRIAPALPDPDLLLVAGAREEGLPGLVEGDGQNLVGGVEGVLDPVAVVGVDVHVGHPKPPREKGLDGHHGVVHETEARGPAGMAVVHPSGRVEGDVGPALGHGQGGLDAGPGEQGGPVVDPGEDGVVAGAQAEDGEPAPILALVGLSEDGQVVLGMKGEDLFLGGRLGLDPAQLGVFQKAVGLHQGQGQGQAADPQGMGGPVIELGVAFIVYKSYGHDLGAYHRARAGSRDLIDGL